MGPIASDEKNGSGADISNIPNHTWAPTGRTLTLFVVSAVLVVGQMYTLIAMYLPISISFGVEPSAVARGSTAFGLAYAIGFLIAGPLSDRYGPRHTVVAGLTTTAITTALIALAPSVSILLASRVPQGLTASMFTPAAISYVANHIRPERRAVVVSCITSSLFAAAAIMQPAAQLLAGAFSWKAAFLVPALLLLLCAFATRSMLQSSPQTREVTITSAFKIIPNLIVQPRLAGLYLAAMTMLGGYIALYSALALTTPVAMDGRPGALLIVRAIGLPALVAVPLLTTVLARHAAPRRLVGSLLLASLALLGASMSEGNIVALTFTTFAFVGAVGVSAPALVEIIGSAASGNRGVATALYAFAMFAGGSIGGQLVSAMASVGFKDVVAGAAGFLAVGAALSIASVPSVLAGPARTPDRGG